MGAAFSRHPFVVPFVTFYIRTNLLLQRYRQSEKINEKLLTSQFYCDILVTYFLNAMKKLFFVQSFFQRAVGWCKTVKTVKEVSFWSRIAELIKRLRSAPLPWQKACWSLTELVDFSANRVVPRFIRP